jgi:hypothetical protein
MDIQKTLRRVLLGALVLTLGSIVASADIYSAPLRGGERCERCERIVENPAVAGEILSKEKSVASPFRTIGCMLTYLRDKDIPADRIFVADRVTGRLTRVERAHFVRVPIEVLSDNPRYGVGEFDYVAFGSSRLAEQFAERHGTEALDWTVLREADAARPVAIAAHSTRLVR